MSRHRFTDRLQKSLEEHEHHPSEYYTARYKSISMREHLGMQTRRKKKDDFQERLRELEKEARRRRELVRERALARLGEFSGFKNVKPKLSRELLQ